MIINLEELSTQLQETYGLLQQNLWLLQASSDALAAHIVLYKALGMNKLTAISCMQELGRRRQLEEDFDYESFIEIESSKIPNIQNFNISSLQNLLNIKQITQLLKPLQ